MNSNPPTAGRNPHDSKSARSFGLVVRIGALVIAAATAGALLLFLPSYPWTKAKTESASLLQKSKSDSPQSAPTQNEKDPSYIHSRNDARAAAAQAEPSG